MNVQNIAVKTVDPDGKWIYRVGGLSAFILGAGYLLTFPVIAYAGGFPPPGIEARLAFMAEHATGWWTVTALMIFTDLLYVPVFLALYQSLKDINKYMMVLAIACAGLFVALDLAVTWTAYSSLIILGSNYAAATSDAQRAIIVVSAGYPSAINDSPLLGIYATLIPASGLLLASLVMRKGIFNKALAHLGVVTGICGILAGVGPIVVGALDIAQYINAGLATIWFFFVGWKLYRLGRQPVAKAELPAFASPPDAARSLSLLARARRWSLPWIHHQPGAWRRKSSPIHRFEQLARQTLRPYCLLVQRRKNESDCIHKIRSP
jgi:hypothetical protein